MKKNIFFLLPLVLIYNQIGFTQKAKNSSTTTEQWNGTITYLTVTKNAGADSVSIIKTKWNYYSETKITANVVNNRASTMRYDVTRNLLWTTSPLGTNKFMEEERKTEINCEGKETDVEVWVEIRDIEEYDPVTKKDRIKVVYRVWVYSPISVGLERKNYKNSFTGEEKAERNNLEFYSLLVDSEEHPTRANCENPFALVGQKTMNISPEGGGFITTIISWNLKRKYIPWKNQLTEKNIATLEPKVKAAATRFIQRVYEELCIKLKVVSGSRTVAEQDYEYSKGRTIPGINVTPDNPLGETVTDAEGGKSNHNFGKAIDVFYATESGGIDIKKRLSPEIVEIAKQEGFKWGGDWKKKPDYPHFEMIN